MPLFNILKPQSRLGKQVQNDEKPAFLKGIMWFAFSGTAMLSAFTLPVHIWAMTNNYKIALTGDWHRMYFLVLFAAALYHSIYRIYTIALDIGFMKFQKIIGGILSLLFLLCMTAAGFLFFIK